MRDYRLVEDATMCPPWCLTLNTTGLYHCLFIDHKAIGLLQLAIVGGTKPPCSLLESKRLMYTILTNLACVADVI